MNIPKEVKDTIRALNDMGFEAYAVGGCVRDFILGREPYDWDITTNAKPEEIQKIFSNSVYENDFGTVAVKVNNEKDKKSRRSEEVGTPTEASGLKIIEITTYRVEEKYTDKRHPDSVKFTKKLEDDLSLRDFTVNAIAYDIQNSKFKIQNDNSKFKIVDPFGGQDDIKNKIIRTDLQF